MLFEYAGVRTYTGAIDIEDIGNFCIRCTTIDGLEFYLCTKTILGKTYILIFGPVLSDLESLLDAFSISYQKIDYKEKIIKKIVLSFINDPKKEITNIEEVSLYEVSLVFPNVFEKFSELGV